MTVRELKSKLEKYNDDTIVVAYATDNDYVVDIFLEEITVTPLNYQSSRIQASYSVNSGSFGDEVILISIAPPKRKY